MRVHHLNCGTLCPMSARLIAGTGGLFARGTMVCHCLLIETEAGLVLVDTGLGLADIADAERLGRSFVTMTRPRLDPDETAARQVERLGFKRDDVRHIVVTHLDLDHAGGLADFPAAKVHIHEPEHRAAVFPASASERQRYCSAQWAHGPAWVKYSAHGEPWFGFAAVRDLEGLPPEILMVPLVGHTRGHVGVAVRTERGWLLHAGDAYFFHGEIDPQRPSCPPGLAFFQRLVAIDGQAQRHNQERLRELVRDHASEVTVTSAHDPVELARLRERGSGVVERPSARIDG
jgi:glyoxylase-like metal-dependent hydrolase (beta-lactamase superfamily II)